MAALGHIAVGLAVGQTMAGLHPRACRLQTITLAVWLATLPDLDSYLGVVGLEHRGPTHSIGFVAGAALLAAVVARQVAWRIIPTVLLVVAAVGSHLVIDMLGGGDPMSLLWPLSPAKIDPLAILVAPSWTTEFRFEMLWSVPFIIVGLWPVGGRLVGFVRRGRRAPSEPS